MQSRARATYRNRSSYSKQFLLKAASLVRACCYDLLQSLSVRLCTSNLHLLCCRLFSQVLERGLTWRYGELWVERLMGEYKRRTKYRTHGAPEKTMMLDYMVRCALQKVRAASTQQLQTWQEHKAGSRVERGSGGEGIDAEFSPQGQLLGDGRPVPAAAWTIELQERVKRALRENLDQEEVALWDAGWGAMVVFKHQRAFLSAGGYANSVAYSRSRTRDGSFVMVAYLTPSGEYKPHVAQVQYYLRLHLPAAATQGEPMDMRVAICDFFPYKAPYEDGDICEFVLFAEDKGSRVENIRRADRDYPVLLNKVEAPLLVQRFTTGGRSYIAFCPLRFKTGGARVQLEQTY